MGRDAPEMKFMYNISYNATIYNKHYVILAPFRFKQPAGKHASELAFNAYSIYAELATARRNALDGWPGLADWLASGSTRLCRRALHASNMGF